MSTLTTTTGPRSTHLTDATVLIGRRLRHIMRTPDELIMAVVLPVMMMMVFVYVFGGALDSSGQYITYIVPGVLLLSLGYSAAQVGVGVTADMLAGVIDRFRSMPVASSAVLTGHVVAGLLRNLAGGLVVIAVALLIGFRPNATVLEWLAAVGMVTLYVLMISWISVVFGLLAKTTEGAGQFSFIILFLPYLSSGFVPTDTMPTVLAVVAENQPVTPVIETLRGLLTGTPIGDHVWWALGWCLVLGVTAFVIAARLFVRRHR